MEGVLTVGGWFWLLAKAWGFCGWGLEENAVYGLGRLECLSRYSDNAAGKV